MKFYGETYSGERPPKIEVLETKVFISENIQEIEIQDEEETGGNPRIEYKFDLTEYDKNEYIEMISKRNDELEDELTETQMALCDVYEMLI